MERQMFCFQCEQTAGCTGCTGKAGVCGKTAPTAALQDELTGALIGLARASADSSLPAGSIDQLLIQGLFYHGNQRQFQRGDHPEPDPPGS